MIEGIIYGVLVAWIVICLVAAALILKGRERRTTRRELDARQYAELYDEINQTPAWWDRQYNALLRTLPDYRPPGWIDGTIKIGPSEITGGWAPMAGQAYALDVDRAMRRPEQPTWNRLTLGDVTPEPEEHAVIIMRSHDGSLHYRIDS